MADAVYPSTPYYCITQARCRLCQFLLEDGEPIVADIGDEGVSCEFSFHRRTTFYDDELDIKLHMCLADECRSRTKAIVCFHTSCHEFRFYAITPEFLAATHYAFPPPLTEEHRRTQYIRQALTYKLQQAKLWPRELPTELWAMVAGLLLQDCATLTAQEQVDGCNSDSAADITFDLNQPVYATYVKIDGRSYIKTLGNKTRNKIKGEISVRLSTPIIQDGDADKDMFVAEDHLGIRRIFFVSPKHVEQWCRAPPSVPGAWWKHISQYNIPSTMVFKTDGFKIRDIEGLQKGSPVWQLPVSITPSVIDLLTLETPKECPNGLRMRFFDCNAPDILGYFVATDGARTFSILSHKQGQQVDTSLFKEIDSPICFWMYMPISKGEYLTDICRRAGRLILQIETVGLTFTTNRGRTAVFGLYGHAGVDSRRIAALPPKPSRVYYNQPGASGTLNVDVIALENSGTTAQDNIPSMPVSVSPCPYTQSNEIWVHTSCSMRRLTGIQPCIDASASHQPVIGMLLYYHDGHRESIGQFRLDWSIEPFAVGETDKLYISGKRTKKNWGYVANVTTQAPLDRAEGRWLDVAQVGALEWWFSSRHSVLFYDNVRLN
ncbi:hypothetical protein FOQG_17119 [Fusarium oxysporum f. sp. raphani 54005]|uniref:Uncharacterized protein n=1 Tax=Fusarium oxysporum f. sp. raphani 54005 TaxID=1089458 RepID=X0B7V4_FUSOX|nr:hypothetical protein FOQG_17119 [Fusarium oxysporum f. sp. raphani 54005]RKK99788.1 hypothetical protein BFJ71_g6035 [Fusarium oxysporum]